MYLPQLELLYLTAAPSCRGFPYLAIIVSTNDRKL